MSTNVTDSPKQLVLFVCLMMIFAASIDITKMGTTRKHSTDTELRDEENAQKILIFKRNFLELGLEFQAHADLVSSLLEVLAIDQSRQTQSHT